MAYDESLAGRVRDELTGQAAFEDALASGARELAFTGRPMRGLVTVDADEVADPAVLERWVKAAAELALSEAVTGQGEQAGCRQVTCR